MKTYYKTLTDMTKTCNRGLWGIVSGKKIDKNKCAKLKKKYSGMKEYSVSDVAKYELGFYKTKRASRKRASRKRASIKRSRTRKGPKRSKKGSKKVSRRTRKSRK